MTQSKEHNNSPDTDPEERGMLSDKKKLPTENNIPGKPVIQNRRKIYTFLD